MGGFQKALVADVRAALTYCYWLQYVGICTLFLYVAVIVGSQTYAYLRSGRWITLSVDRMLQNAGAYRSEDWRGLAPILEQIPASVAFFAIGMVWLVVLTVIAHRRRPRLG